ncbi:hypothetical protein NEILACOT_04132 [Neisseria lactamica ATCC 23970]|uniref:Uncharacterized protein n=1 Tax=Neisseria lactamica ATCC 23970 TaxID=546265 RepID=D0W9C3_NEILA|nr:hypothetical protein NEILACOT_04132 [Neisseria lactamica ATCC 23970]
MILPTYPENSKIQISFVSFRQKSGFLGFRFFKFQFLSFSF